MMSFEEPQEELTPTPPPPPSTFSRLFGDRDPLVITVLGVVLLGLALICVFGVLILRATNQTEDGGVLSGLFGGDEEEGEVAEPPRQPTTIPDVTSIAVVYEPVPLDSSQQISLTLDAPALLDVNGLSLSVTSAYTEPMNLWEYDSGGNAAVWSYGTIVNYIFALPADDDIKRAIDALVQGDSIVVETKAGTIYEFIYTGNEFVDDTGDPSNYAQNRPSLTLIWQGDRNADERLFVYGDYVVANEELEQNDGLTCELGETCQLGNTRITVTGATHAVDRPEAPPGFALYLIDYTIENSGSAQLDTGLLRFVLIDDLGNQYSLNALASQAGNYPLLGGFVNNGESRQVTAGYQIPGSLASSNLRWVVSRVDNPSQMEVVIPFLGNSPADAVVTLQQAIISDDGTSLIVSGQVTNPGQQPLVVSESDILLSDGASIFFVFSTNPSFPWTIGAGQQLDFTLTFQRPSSASATFELLNYSFQLSGLR